MFSKQTRTAPELVTKTCNALTELESAKKEKQVDKALDDVSKYLGYVKLWMFSEDGQTILKDNVTAFVREACKTQLLSLLVYSLKQLDFETRRDTAICFTTILRARVEDRNLGHEYVEQHPELLDTLIEGYGDPAIALNCGGMLRECIKHPGLTRRVLFGSKFVIFFQKVEMANFEIASDAFSTFKELLTRHKSIACEYMLKNYDAFTTAYNSLLQSSNYVTRRQTLKLLSDIILDPVFMDMGFTTRWISNPMHLKLVMNLLKDSSRTIQLDAFHVFKVFVGNPQRPAEITEILLSNKDKLCKYLQDFHTDRGKMRQAVARGLQSAAFEGLLLLSSSWAASDIIPSRRRPTVALRLPMHRVRRPHCVFGSWLHVQSLCS